MEPDVLLFSAAFLLVLLHSAWGVEPLVGLDVVEVGVSSPRVELTVRVFVDPEVKVLGDIYSVEEFTVTVDVDPQAGFDILGMEYFLMNLFRNFIFFWSDVLYITGLGI